MIYDDVKDHERAKAFAQHEHDIREMRNRAQRWRLTDCDAGTLNRMRHAMLDELDEEEKRLKEANEYFTQCIAAGDPILTEQAVQRVNRISAEWTAHHDRVQKIDRALIERHLRDRLITLFGSEKNLNRFDSIIFGIIVVVIIMTIGEFVMLAIDPEFHNETLITIDTIICLILLGDFFMRFWLCEDRAWYFRNYWVDFVSSIPLVGMLRVGRLVRVARFARLLRLFRLGRAMRAMQSMGRGLDSLEQTMQMSLLRRSFIFGLVMLFVGAYAIYEIELRPTMGEVDGFSDSFWWSFTTVITGGFGDLHNPTTNVGRLLTGSLVLMGLIIVGIFTASLTSVLVGDNTDEMESSFFQIEEQLESVTQRLDLLSSETNQGLQVLETVAQQLSNQHSPDTIAELLTRTMLDSFEAIQSSLHIYDAAQQSLTRIQSAGLALVQPQETIAVGQGFVGRVSAEILQQDLDNYDVEPMDTPCIPVKGTSVACPLVAQGQFLGVMHLVLPSHLGRFYLYNRAPMTLTHHAAIALHAVQLEERYDELRLARPRLSRAYLSRTPSSRPPLSRV